MSTLGSAAPTIVVLLVYHIKENEDFLGAQGLLLIFSRPDIKIFFYLLLLILQRRKEWEKSTYTNFLAYFYHNEIHFINIKENNYTCLSSTTF